MPTKRITPRVDLLHACGTRYRYQYKGCRCECCCAAQAQYRKDRLAANPRAAEYHVRYREEHREERNRKNREYYQRTKPEHYLRHRRYREQNAEAVAAQIARWRDSNPGWASAYSENRRARKLSKSGTYSAADVRSQRDRQRGRCFWCGEKLGARHHVDHVVPLALGGTNGPENIVVSCRSCNLSKGAKHPADFGGIMF